MDVAEPTQLPYHGIHLPGVISMRVEDRLASAGNYYMGIYCEFILRKNGQQRWRERDRTCIKDTKDPRFQEILLQDQVRFSVDPRL